MAAPSADVSLTVKPDFGQFYLRRAGAETWPSDEVPSLGWERHLWSSGEFVVVCTVRKYGTTPLRIEVLDAPPSDPPDERWQHVVEESLVPGGDLEVFDWPGDAPVATIPIPHESVRLRVCWTGLAESNHFEGLDERGNSDESLLLQVWRREPGAPRVVRWWPPLELPAPSERSGDGRRQHEGLEVVVEAIGRMELAFRCAHPYPELPGSAREHTSANAVYRDPRDGSLWADGYDVRRTLREVTDAEVDAMGRHRAG